jgi:formate-dependent nitrite reductase membrane component NrfD
VNAFEVVGPILILWAIVVGILGITRENFPASDNAARLVGAISVILVALAIGAAIYTGATEKKEGEKSALPSALV